MPESLAKSLSIKLEEGSVFPFQLIMNESDEQKICEYMTEKGREINEVRRERKEPTSCFL